MDHVTTPEGLRLEILTMGPPDGYPLVYHSGSPSAAVRYAGFEPALAQAGLRLVTYSRPGYGESTPRRARAGPWRVADDVRDTVAILDDLGIAEFVTLGWSGGGPRSLACAAMLPGRCLAATCGVGIAPVEEYDGDIREGMGAENGAEYTAAFAGPDALTEHLEQHWASAFSVTAEQIGASL